MSLSLSLFLARALICSSALSRGRKAGKTPASNPRNTEHVNVTKPKKKRSCLLQLPGVRHGATFASA